MDIVEFKALVRRAERRVPIEFRANLIMSELHEELNEFAASARREKRFHTRDEWKRFRRSMLRGRRIAARFKDERIMIFRNMFATATTYLRGSGVNDFFPSKDPR